MRIGIDLQVLAQKPWTGIGKYALHLAKALIELKTNHEFVFLTTETSPYSPPHEEGRGEVIVLPRKRVPFWSSHITYARIFQRANLDVLHGPANSLPLFYRGRGVITVHDLAIYRHPEWFPRGQWLSTKIVVPRSIKKADHIIVPSEATKRDLMEMFRVSEEKISVIAHGVEFEKFSIINDQFSINSQLPISKPYILFVGTLEPRKNVNRLIEAYKALPKDILEEYDLVVVGSKGWGTPTSSPPILQGETGGEREGVKFLDYVPDDQLPALYQNASLFVYPSLYEGFGMPVLEAMAAGVPVITSHQVAETFNVDGQRRASLLTQPSPPQEEREKGRGGAEERRPKPIRAAPPYTVYPVDPYSVEEIRQAIIKLTRDAAYSSQISEAGIQRARQFSWINTARKTLEVYEKSANS